MFNVVSIFVVIVFGVVVSVNMRLIGSDVSKLMMNYFLRYFIVIVCLF